MDSARSPAQHVLLYTTGHPVSSILLDYLSNLMLRYRRPVPRIHANMNLQCAILGAADSLVSVRVTMDDDCAVILWTQVHVAIRTVVVEDFLNWVVRHAHDLAIEYNVYDLSPDLLKGILVIVTKAPTLLWLGMTTDAVMVAGNQNLDSIESLDAIESVRPWAKGYVSKVEDGISWLDNGVPVANEHFIVVTNVCEWSTLPQMENVLVTEMCVTCEEFCHAYRLQDSFVLVNGVLTVARVEQKDVRRCQTNADYNKVPNENTHTNFFTNCWCVDWVSLCWRW